MDNAKAIHALQREIGEYDKTIHECNAEIEARILAIHALAQATEEGDDPEKTAALP